MKIVEKPVEVIKEVVVERVVEVLKEVVKEVIVVKLDGNLIKKLEKET